MQEEPIFPLPLSSTGQYGNNVSFEDINLPEKYPPHLFLKQILNATESYDLPIKEKAQKSAPKTYAADKLVKKEKDLIQKCNLI